MMKGNAAPPVNKADRMQNLRSLQDRWRDADDRRRMEEDEVVKSREFLVWFYALVALIEWNPRTSVPVFAL